MPRRGSITDKSKEIIYNVYKYLIELDKKTELEIAEALRRKTDAAAEACGVSVTTVKRVCAEAKRPGFTSFTLKPQKRRSQKSETDSTTRHKIQAVQKGCVETVMSEHSNDEMVLPDLYEPNTDDNDGYNGEIKQEVNIKQELVIKQEPAIKQESSIKDDTEHWDTSMSMHTT